MIYSRPHFIPLAFGLLLLAATGASRCLAETISLSADQILYSGAQPDASGSISLAGGDLYPDPTFGALSPASAQTAISNGPVCGMSSDPYMSNLRETSYQVRDGALLGSAISGASYGKVTCSGVLPGDAVTLNGATFAATAYGAAANQFSIGATDAATAANLRAAIDASTDPGIANRYQAAKDFNGDNVVWIESLTPGSAGDGTPLFSSDSHRLAITAFSHGADGATPANPHWWMARYIRLDSPLAAGEKVRFQFDLTGIEVNPLAGANSYLTVYFNGDASVNYEAFSMADGRVTSREYAPTHDASGVTVGIAVVDYAGAWGFKNLRLLESAPSTYASVGELTIPVNLSYAAGAAVGDPATGLGSAVKRVGFLTADANKASNLAGLRAGDVIITDIGDLDGIYDRQRDVIALARSQGLEIYGYVALGSDDNLSGTLPYRQSQLLDFFNRGRSLGIDGIYFDVSSNGPAWPRGFGVSRYRQIWAVNQCHSLGLKVMFNDTDTVLDNAVNAGDANLDEGVQHGINDGSPIPFWPGDGISAESFGLRSDGIAQDWFDFQATGLRMLKAKKSLGIKIYGLFYELPTRTDQTKECEERFAFYSSVIYNLDGYTLFSSESRTDDYERPAVYVGSAWSDDQPSADASGDRISRKTDAGVVQITRDESVEETSDAARNGDAFADQTAVSVTSMTVSESLNGGAISWMLSSSEDGANYGAETPLVDNGGTITGFPAVSPSYVRLRAILSTPNPMRSPALVAPIRLSVDYSASARSYGGANSATTN